MRVSTVLLALAALCCCASAARIAPDVALDVSALRGQGNLRSSSQAWLNLLRGDELMRRRGSSEAEEMEEGLHNRIFAIRFEVPPSMSRSFEDKWMKMEKDEKDADVFTLSSSALDNVFYYGYSEFKKHRDLHDHLMSDHFNDFASWVDSNDVHWHLELLNDVSYDLERKEGKGDKEPDWDRYIPKEYRKYVPDEYRPSKQHHRKGRKGELSTAALSTLPNNGQDASDEQVLALYNGLMRRKESVHIVVNYYVPPDLSTRFVDAWTKMAKDTIEESGNRVYSLRRSATDNTRFWTYGNWDSMRDYIDHTKSKHLQKFVGDLDDNDIFFWIQILDVV